MLDVEVTKIGGKRADGSVPMGEVIKGKAYFLPKVGENYMVTRSEDPQEPWILVTTQVQHVENIENEYRFQTQNSVYKVIVKGGTSETR
jgi:hypothetical protein